jgi:hypothetical protein
MDERRREAEFDKLVELIRTAIVPDSGDHIGGRGTNGSAPFEPSTYQPENSRPTPV